MDIRTFFKTHPRVAVALSGGVDSAVLLALACCYAQKVKAYYVQSQFQPSFEKEDARATAKQLNAELEVIGVDVLSYGEITSNPRERCYNCKRKIFGAICAAAKNDGFDTVLDGTNASDDIDDRPGFKAITEMSVLSPLRDCGYTKPEIRALAKELSLPLFNKPSYACLATRIPMGTPITADLLCKTERAEAAMREMGFKNFRVRYSHGAARLELSKIDLALYEEKKAAVLDMLLTYYESVEPEIKERSDE